MKNADLHVKNIIQKWWTEKLMKLVTTILLCFLRLPTVLSPTEKSKFQALFNASK